MTCSECRTKEASDSLFEFDRKSYVTYEAALLGA